ncbi:ATP-binding protein [Blautia glucerasea]|uniref:ATP-binding protein n=1 Tax=Blautia glucerasea TaxID=536633 RepID=UPI001D026A9F|nr:ATP-binding protein [Blautia glucerasea]MCB5386991.1 ATP-binding protein [Blautia glucerasea]MCB5421543.1 ATP-binding protein [Blautia luti]
MLKNISFMDIFDVCRVLLGAISAEIVFMERAAEHREHFPQRVMVSSLGVLGFILLCIPMYWFRNTYGGSGIAALITAVWWMTTGIVSMCCIYYCYQVTVCNLIFQCILGIALENLVTLVLQYLVCKICFPSLQTEHTALYVFITVLFYAAFDTMAYFLLVRKSVRGQVVVKEDWRTFLVYLTVYIIITGMGDVTNLIFHWSKKDGDMFGGIEMFTQLAVPYFCIVVNVIVNLVIVLLQNMTYRILSLQKEKEMIQVLQKEKEQQYLFSKENVDLINQKCHDLKRQIRALQMVHGEERERLFKETEEAVQFYDAHIKTGNDVLDTILTEKSFVCARQGIRFSCNIHAEKMDMIDVIDFYTLISNGLDNAIECVSKYENNEKKVINVAVLERGSMLHIFIDNYFDGELEFRNGFPVTSKEDKGYHGYGVKSMQMIAKKYSGDIRISVQNHTFSLQIMLPVEC